MTRLPSWARAMVCLLCLSASAVLYAAPRDQTQATDTVAVALQAQGKDKPIDVSNLFSDQIDLQKPPFSELLDKTQPPCFIKHHALIIHLARWAASDSSGPFQLLSSDWNVYHATGNASSCTFKKTITRTNSHGEDSPLLYADKSGFLIGINSFVKLDANNGPTTTSLPVAVTIAYKVSATPETPENVQNLGMLISGLLGVTKAGGGAPTPYPLYVAAGKIDGYKRTPFTFNIGFNLAPTAAAKPEPPASSERLGTPTATLGPPARKTTPVPIAYVGIPYSEHLPFEGGIGQKTFTLHAGGGYQPPDGLLLDPNGILHGTPTTEVSGSTFFVEVTDSATPPLKTQIMYEITVAAAPPPGSIALKGGAPAAKPPSPATKPAAATDTSTDATKTDQQTAAVIDCTAVADAKTACSFKRSFRSQDKEYWDIGLSVPIPGVKETKYTLSNGTAKSSVTTHTDVYAFFDIYPLAYRFDKRSAAPHLALGLPLTSQTFYRPFFGAAENFTNWTGLRRHGFPLEMSVFAGVVYMRVQIPTQTTSGGTTTTVLQSTRTVKGLYGAELSVTDLVSKLGGKSKK